MKNIRSIYYQKLIKKDEYLGIEVDIEQGDNPMSVMLNAQAYVNKMYLHQQQLPDYITAKTEVKNRKKYNGFQINEFRRIIKEFEKRHSEFVHSESTQDLTYINAGENHEQTTHGI